MYPYPWLKEYWRHWCQQRQADKIPNALLISGCAGVGKSALAVQMAKLLLCLSPLADKACGECKSCRLLMGGSHPDLKTIEPEEGSRAIKIGQVRELTEFIQEKPKIGRHIVAILNPAEAMNLYSANALLKTLEEPPGSATIILISQQASLLLPTIRSRCQLLQIATPRHALAAEWLASSTDRSAEEASALLSAAGGQPLTALKWNESSYLQQQGEILVDWAGYLNGRLDAFSLAAKWTKLEQEWLLTWLTRGLRDVLTAHVLASNELASPMQVLLKRLQPEKLWQLYQFILEIKGSLNEQRNLNLQLALEHWLLLHKQKTR